jgi:hypothetical protein
MWEPCCVQQRNMDDISVVSCPRRIHWPRTSDPCQTSLHALWNSSLGESLTVSQHANQLWNKQNKHGDINLSPDPQLNLKMPMLMCIAIDTRVCFTIKSPTPVRPTGSACSRLYCKLCALPLSVVGDRLCIWNERQMVTLVETLTELCFSRLKYCPLLILYFFCTIKQTRPLIYHERILFHPLQGSQRKIDWVHHGEYLASGFLLESLDVSQEITSGMEFIQCTTLANLVKVLISSAGLNRESLWTWTDMQKCRIYSLPLSVICVRKHTQVFCHLFING